MERRKGGGRPHFDLTINIPTLILLIGLALAGLVRLNNMRDIYIIVMNQHNLMWSDYLSRHPEYR